MLKIDKNTSSEEFDPTSFKELWGNKMVFGSDFYAPLPKHFITVGKLVDAFVLSYTEGNRCAGGKAISLKYSVAISTIKIKIKN